MSPYGALPLSLQHESNTMPIKLMTFSAGDKPRAFIRNGKLLVHREGQTNRPCCCPDEPPVDPDPAVPCDQCATDRTPAIVQLVLDGIVTAGCDCNGFFGTINMLQDPDPCNWSLPIGFPCGYNLATATAVGFGGFVTTYTITVANTTNGHKFTLTKNVFGDGNNDCLTHFNNGDWFLETSQMFGDCDMSGISYDVNAF